MFRYGEFTIRLYGYLSNSTLVIWRWFNQAKFPLKTLKYLFKGMEQTKITRSFIDTKDLIVLFLVTSGLLV